ncbi:MAG: LysM peptidoglycan-binding domain-containing protein [Candidatus Acidiferrum sp.]
MTHTDLNGPMSLQPRRAGLGRISRSALAPLSIALILCCATFGAAVSRAQDQQDQSVAEAARQERARKQELQKRARHVYTEDDLKRSNILTPQDRAVVEARRKECAQKNNCSPAPSQNSPASLDTNSQTPGISLGEVARRYRKQEEWQALKPKQSEPFHLSIGTPALASPMLPERPAIRPPARPALRPKMSSHVFRRDPFSAVPLRPEIRRAEIPSSVRENVSPKIHAYVRADVLENIRPAVRPKISGGIPSKIREDFLSIVQPNVHPGFSKEVRPTLRARGQKITPALPQISSRPAASSILIEPMQPRALAKSAQPVAPVASVAPTQPQLAPGSSAISNQKIVRVQSGDSLWRLAQQNLGRGNRWPELLAANRRIANPNRIRAGARLYLPATLAIPPATRNAASSTVGRSASTVKVRKGDTLWSLARSTLGRSSYWPCLASANPSISDPNRIYENQDLLIPTGCSP